jgi:hypothetical protein
MKLPLWEAMPMKPGRPCRGKEGGVELYMGIDHPDAVGSGESYIVFPGNGLDFLLPDLPLAPDLVEPGGHDNGTADSLLPAGPQGFGHDFGRQDNISQVRHLGQVTNPGIGVKVQGPFSP